MIFSKIFVRIRLLVALFRLVRRPEKTDLVFTIADCVRELGAFLETADRLGSDPESAKVIKERKLLGTVDMGELLKLPKDTLGYRYAEHMTRLNLKQDFYKKLEIKDDISFVLMRMRQTHDLWHVVTGFNTEVVGE